MKRHTLVAALAVLVATASALPVATSTAQQAATQHHGTMGMHGSAMQGAMERMQQGMAMPSSGDPDVDFARMMIPHHQGAIDMARSELANGKDPELRKLAGEIIQAQEKEIAFLQEWLRKHGR
jgi:uncharacterized protein (DUF305 family)